MSVLQELAKTLNYPLDLARVPCSGLNNTGKKCGNFLSGVSTIKARGKLETLSKIEHTTFNGQTAELRDSATCTFCPTHQGDARVEVRIKQLLELMGKSSGGEQRRQVPKLVSVQYATPIRAPAESRTPAPAPPSPAIAIPKAPANLDTMIRQIRIWTQYPNQKVVAYVTSTLEKLVLDVQTGIRELEAEERAATKKKRYAVPPGWLQAADGKFEREEGCGMTTRSQRVDFPPGWLKGSDGTWVEGDDYYEIL
ncbi:uncharacterized protein LY89DRAFT_713916 [Mollisia scopiformis]|uniref:Uncharacterized protein n=1 Tax=Mollisia scopiformis TaxID=149040 RepID=A0A194XT34_MOLSC|nr:uncharacterized protein LY89DRAFT_713916 [Mollisia scopiformis]KUJ23465.1 hypothetical protein LY89DRAFT_713916 [Mollisia scopiformis]